jgi:hypothetical protein
MFIDYGSALREFIAIEDCSASSSRPMRGSGVNIG